MRKFVVCILFIGIVTTSWAQVQVVQTHIQEAKKDSIRGSYSSAIGQYQKAVALDDPLAYNRIGSYYAAIANMYHLQNNYPDSALQYFYLSLAQYDSAKNESGFLHILNSLHYKMYQHIDYATHIFSYPWLTYQPDWIQYGLQEVQAYNDTLAEFYLYSGENQYVVKGATGYVRGTHNIDSLQRKDSVTGIFLIDTIGPNWSYGRLLIQNNESIDNIKKHPDYIVLSTRVPEHDYPSILYRSFFNGVDWKVEDTTAVFFNKQIAIHYSSPFYDAIIAQKLLEDFSLNAKELKTNPPPSILTPLTKGRYAGQTILEVLENLQAVDIQLYLDWLHGNIQSLSGTHEYIIVDFVLWLNNTLPGPNTMYEAYSRAGNDMQKKLILDSAQRHNIPWTVYSDILYQEAKRDYQNKNYAVADSKAAFLYSLSSFMNDKAVMALSRFRQAYLLLERNEETRSNQYFEESIQLYKSINVLDNVYLANGNIAYNYNKLKQYDKSEKFLLDNMQLAEAAFKKEAGDDNRNQLKQAYEQLATNYNHQKLFDKNIAMRLLAISMCTNAEDSIENINYLNTSYGKANYYNQQLEWSKRLVKMHKAKSDIEQAGSSLNDIAYAYSNLGMSEQAKKYYKEAYDWLMENGKKKNASFSLSALAQMYWTLYQKDSAIHLHQQAYRLSGEAEDTLAMAYSQSKLGSLYKEIGQVEKSTEAFSIAESLFLKVPLSKGFADMLGDQAENFKAVKEYDQAMSYYQQSAEIYRLVGESIHQANRQYDVASIWSLKDRYDLSESIVDSIVAFSRKENDITGLMNYYFAKSDLAQAARSDVNEALSYMYQAMQLAEKVENPLLQANVAHQIGTLLPIAGKTDSADYYLQLAKNIYVSQNQQSGILYTDLQKGYYFMGLGEIDSAQQYYNAALSIAQTIRNITGEANASSGLIDVAFFRGEYSKALEMQKSVLQKYLDLKDPWGIANAYLSMGNILNQQTEYKEAIRFYEKADSIYKEKKYLRARLNSINNPSTIYYAQGNYEKSLELMLACMDILKQVDDVYMKRVITGNLGELYIDFKNYDLAQKYLDTAYDLSVKYKDKHGKYVSEWILGRLKYKTGKYPEAIDFFTKAKAGMLQTGEKLFQAGMENDWGKTYLQMRKPDSAAVHFKRGIAISRAIQSDKYIWEPYAGLANIAFAADDHPQAILYLDTAIGIVEGIKLRLSGGEDARKIFSSGESVLELYQKMAAALKKLGRNDEALLYLEKANIENINTRLNQNHVETEEDALAREKKQKLNIIEKQKATELLKPAAQQNTETIAKLEQMQTIAEKDYMGFVQNLAKKYPNRTDLQQINAREFKKERGYIPTDVALLSYLITPNELSIFIVQKDSLIIKDIPIHKELFEEKIKNYYAALSRFTGTAQRGNVKIEKKGPPEISVDSLGAELYDILIEPAMQALEGKSQIAIIPSGYLCFIPFQALGKVEAGAMKYFGNEKSVFYVNRITGVTNGRSGALEEMNIIAVGNADNSLPFAEDEVKNIAAQVPGTLSLIRQDATRKNLLSQKENYNILHMATHGILDYNHPDSSYLVLAKDPSMQDNGRLLINDIYSIEDLDQFNLVTLSACETAVAKDLVEGWPISTAAAFLEAGVSTVVASLWQVDDKATGMLMQSFYKNLETMSKVEALRKAQKSLQMQPAYAHPYYWAAFQVVGLWQ